MAREELKAIPEYFYSKTKLPVITPSNVRLFIWEICSSVCFV